jgi:hypothetical protein
MSGEIKRFILSVLLYLKRNRLCLFLLISVKVNCVGNCNHIRMLQFMQVHRYKIKMLRYLTWLDVGKFYVDFPKSFILDFVFLSLNPFIVFQYLTANQIKFYSQLMCMFSLFPVLILFVALLLFRPTSSHLKDVQGRV